MVASERCRERLGGGEKWFRERERGYVRGKHCEREGVTRDGVITDRDIRHYERERSFQERELLKNSSLGVP